MLQKFHIQRSHSEHVCSERENAGLNITCASRVFLLESVVHHGFEVQGKGLAIACCLHIEDICSNRTN